MIYLEGKAVPADEARALELIRAAADQNLKMPSTNWRTSTHAGSASRGGSSERPVALLERIGKWGDLKVRYENGWGTDRELGVWPPVATAKWF